MPPIDGLSITGRPAASRRGMALAHRPASIAGIRKLLGSSSPGNTNPAAASPRSGGRIFLEDLFPQF